MESKIFSRIKYSFPFLIFVFIIYWGGCPLKANNFSIDFCQRIVIRPRTRKDNSSFIPVREKSEIAKFSRLNCENERPVFSFKKNPLKSHSYFAFASENKLLFFPRYLFNIRIIPFYLKFHSILVWDNSSFFTFRTLSTASMFTAEFASPRRRGID